MSARAVHVMQMVNALTIPVHLNVPVTLGILEMDLLVQVLLRQSLSIFPPLPKQAY